MHFPGWKNMGALKAWINSLFTGDVQIRGGLRSELHAFMTSAQFPGLAPLSAAIVTADAAIAAATTCEEDLSATDFLTPSDENWHQVARGRE